jgi:hypothetical protein
MIRVKRPNPIKAFKPPDGSAVKASAALIASVSANPTSKIVFKSSVWSPAKKPYWKAQHNKCIFCEAFVPAVAHGDVEHFRPKNGVSDTKGGKITTKTYWWLAYDWTNYWASCQLCNQSFKKNLFPLAVGGVRAVTPSDDLSLEKPLLIDPEKDDPRDHLEFRAEIAFARNQSARGQATIEICGLNRPELIELRRTSLVLIQGILDVYTASENWPNIKQKTGQTLRAVIKSEHPFSAMARDLIAREAPELLTP